MTGDGVPAKSAWDRGRREQLRRWAALPLRDQLAALEEMADLAERLTKAPALGSRHLERQQREDTDLVDDRRRP